MSSPPPPSPSRLATEAAALASAYFVDSMMQATTAAATAAAGDDVDDRPPRPPQGRYLRGTGTLHAPKESFWYRIKKRGNDAEFLHFTSMTRDAFDKLSSICKNYINTHSIKTGKKSKKNLGKRRIFDHQDIIAMTLRWVLSRSEQKDIHPHLASFSRNLVDTLPWVKKRLCTASLIIQTQLCSGTDLLKA